MSQHFDALETRTADERESALAIRLPQQIAHAKANTAYFGESLKNVDGELGLHRLKCGDCHAGAIERNAVAQAHIVQVAGRTNDGQALAMRRSVAQGLNLRNAANAADDSCKHPAIFAGKGQQAFRLPFGRVGSRLKLVSPGQPGDHTQVWPNPLQTLEAQIDGFVHLRQRTKVEHALSHAQ